ncbi:MULTISPECIES: pyridoxal-dependent decarboxylase [unclassified Streptomyces]|uniref:pyridoxal phosphate-dependent decarboxylase family protein n=1 Tax=unclassified Streptomyces TaxID=2593676 RepID=UPI0021566064|nr:MULTISPECIES: pyridoxal-dependent decarboxylase [unclassified Streptomyces]
MTAPAKAADGDAERGREPYRPGELALSEAEMLQAGYRAVETVVARLRHVAADRPHALAAPAELRALIGEPVPEDGGDLTDALEWAADHVLPVGVRFDHPRCFAFVPTTGNYPAVLADALAAAFLSVPGAWFVGAGPTQLELTTLGWLCELLGLPRTHGGLFVSGGSVANLTALAAARDHRAGGEGELARARLYCSTQAHPSVARAAHLIGLRREQLIALPPGPRLRLVPDDVRRRVCADRASGLLPFAVVATVGTTGTGAIDPLPELAALCQKYGMWLHADGAHGAAAAITTRGRALCAGLDRADSLTVDPHKWLFQPYEAGCVLFRRPELLRATYRMDRHRLDDGYLLPARARGLETNLDDYGPQQSRGLRALKLWLSLKTFGAGAFRRAVDGGIDLAEYAARQVTAHPELRLVTPASLGILTLRYQPESGRVPIPRPAGPAPGRATATRFGASGTRYDAGLRAEADALQDDISAAVCATGRAMVLTTEVRGARALRLCTINPASTRADVDETLDLIVEAGRRL